MITIRLTAKLQKRLRLKPADLVSEDALVNKGKLGEWIATQFLATIKR